MPETGLSPNRIREHLRRRWYIYLIGAVLLCFLNNLIFTVTSDVPGETDSLYVESIPLDASATVTALESFGFDPYWPVTKS